MAIRVETPDDGRPHRVSAVGVDPAALAVLARAGTPERADALALYTGDHVPGPDVPAVIGTHVVDEAGLHFLPRFPLVPGLPYTARFTFGGERAVHTFDVAIPAGREPPRAMAVHPSSQTLPENALRLYVHFSRPMSARGVHRHVRLLGPGGREVPLAFVEVEDGLWDPGRRRLTLLFHPGRVKRGVAPGERLGPPLRAGGEYRLVIDGAIADAAGTPMGAAYERVFRVVEADRASPRAAELRVEPPATPRGPVKLLLPEPLDHALLQRWVWVEDRRGVPVPGHVDVGDDEASCTFTPAQRWAAGRYTVRLRAALEDRAGNRFDRLFDRETAPGDAPASSPEPVSVPFEVPPS